jgi:hypothetical protein
MRTKYRGMQNMTQMQRRAGRRIAVSVSCTTS